MAAPVAARRLDELVFVHLRQDFPRLREDQTVAEALAYLRAQALGERVVYFYVVDDDERLRGVVPTRRLLMADAGRFVGSIMVTDVVTLPAEATMSDALEAFVKHRLLALPVVGALGRLCGTVDVAVVTGEVSQLGERRRADDVFQLLGLHASRGVSAWRGFVDRFPSLLCNVGGGLIAAFIASAYEPLLDAVILLALFIPVVLALSESIGMQSVTLTLQGLHDSRVDWRFVAGSLRREVKTAVLLGASCGLVIGTIALVWKRQVLVAAAVGITMVFTMAIAALFGVALPAILRALRRDPRIASGPIVLALADFVTLLVYFTIAGMLLKSRMG